MADAAGAYAADDTRNRQEHGERNVNVVGALSITPHDDDRKERMAATDKSKPLTLPAGFIERSILLVRDEKVMLDADLARLYGVSVGALNQAVKRNLGRFPDDFMFQLTSEEAESLRSQFVTLKKSGRGKHRKYLPYAFTEQGVAMLSSVLRSERAVSVNVEIMRAFVRLRKMLATHADLARKLEALEKKYDKQFVVVFDAIRKLMEPPPEKPKGRIGFRADRE